MKIVIDVRCITGRMHGIGRHAVNIINCLAQIDRENKYLVLIRKQAIENFKNLPDNFKIKTVDIKPYTIAEQIMLPLILKKEDFDVYYTPNYTAPLFLNKPVIFTIHDLIHMLYPHDYTFFHRIYYRVVVKKLAKKCYKVLVVSNSTKSDVIRLLEVPSDKIIVNYNGVDERFSPGDRKKSLEYVFQRFGLNRKFILWVGNEKPHKNLKNTIEAFKIVSNSISDLHLLVIGAPEQKYQTESIDEKVHFLKISSDDDLVALYRSAEALVVPSLYEGFCLPVLEAFACGCPVLTSDRASVPEIAGDSAIFVNPEKPGEIAEAIGSIITNPSLKESLKRKGIERAKQFLWKISAEKLLGIFENIKQP